MTHVSCKVQPRPGICPERTQSSIVFFAMFYTISSGDMQHHKRVIYPGSPEVLQCIEGIEPSTFNTIGQRVVHPYIMNFDFFYGLDRCKMKGLLRSVKNLLQFKLHTHGNNVAR